MEEGEADYSAVREGKGDYSAVEEGEGDCSAVRRGGVLPSALHSLLLALVIV